jgi:hypothetical protein
MEVNSPKYLLLTMAVPLGVIGVFWWMIFRGSDFAEHRDELMVVGPEMHYSTDEEGNYVSIIGTIQNVGDIDWEDPHFEVRFFDSSDELIDTISSVDYGLVLVSDEESTFRIRARADKPEQSYHRFEVLIRRAREMRWF